MLRLSDITKDYPVASGAVHALRGVSIDFRSSEFVAVLGQSGCGKTTLLNIIGGLDRYTSGDLVIDGRSTTEYRAADWDAYRNHTVGFVFQSYNLIMHQSVLSNVEMALKISGVSAAERREKAKAALERVGLADQMDKRPTMLSGGQMQRVAIARALVNDPSIILADEPTGALDSETSVQIMDLLREVASDRLVIMVTHNPELAEQYATRIVRMRDGQITDDSNPPQDDAVDEAPTAKPGRARLSFSTALGLSLNNLFTKKGRTLLTSFAGAIGIIGIALILSLSSGMNDYIKKFEADTMGSYPISLQKETVDFSSMMGDDGGSLFGSPSGTSGTSDGSSDDGQDASSGTITSDNIVAKSVQQEKSMTIRNNLAAFKTYLDDHRSELDGSVSAIEYGYDVTPQVKRFDDDGSVVPVSPATIDDVADDNDTSTTTLSSQTSSSWTQLPDDEGQRNVNYHVVAGAWPQAADEVALVLDSSSKVSDFTLYTLGVMDTSRFDDLVKAIENDEAYDDPQESFSYDDVLGREYTVLAQSDMYQENEDGVWIDESDDKDFIASQMKDTGTTVHISGILQINDDANDASSGVAYTSALTHDLMDKAANSAVVKQQLADPDTNVLTGKSFDDEDVKKNKDTSASFLLGVSWTPSDGAATTPAAEATENATSDRAASSTSSVKTAVFTPSSVPVRTDAAGSASVFTVDDPVDPGTGGEGPGGTGGEGSGGAGGEGSGGTTEPADTYTVRFLNYDGSELSQPVDTYHAGDALTNVPQETPARPDDDAHTYVFLGWKSSTTKTVYTDVADLPKVTESVDYAAYYYAAPKGSEVPSVPGTVPGGGLPGMPGGSGLPSGDLSSYGDLAALLGQSVSPTSALDLEALMASGAYGAGSAGLSGEQLSSLMAQMSGTTPSDYDSVMAKLGYCTADQPSNIFLYPVDFNSKDTIEQFISDYNAQVQNDDDKVTYTDVIAMLTSSLTSIVDTISAVLIAFTAISLVVSSIMIAIITYISVLERTKEIGILRALGVSKNGVSKIFNAETFIEGLISGVIGIVVTLLLCLPINAVIESMFGVSGIASLPPLYAVMLIGISVALTLIAGFLPSRMAAKKDPVAALRTE